MKSDFDPENWDRVDICDEEYWIITGECIGEGPYSNIRYAELALKELGGFITKKVHVWGS